MEWKTKVKLVKTKVPSNPLRHKWQWKNIDFDIRFFLPIWIGSADAYAIFAHFRSEPNS